MIATGVRAIERPNADVILEVLGEFTSVCRYFKLSTHFAFRPLVGDVLYFDGDTDRSAKVTVVEWFLFNDQGRLQVRLEMSGGLDQQEEAYLKENGWVEREDALG